MANLTQPYINFIPAQASGGHTIPITANVLGGDLIGAISWQVSTVASSLEVATGNLIVNDPGGSGVRSFALTLDLGASTLQQNIQYKVRVYTTAVEDNTATNSVWSAWQIFTAYTAPTISVAYDDNGTPTPLGNNTTFSSQPVSITLDLVKATGNPAVLSTSVVSLYDSGNNLVFQSGTIYGEGTALISGFAGSTYKMVIDGVTADGMALQKTITGLKYSASAPTGDYNLSVANVCEQAAMRLSVSQDGAESGLTTVIQRSEDSTNWVDMYSITDDFTSFIWLDQLVGKNRTYWYRLKLVSSNGAIAYTSSVSAVCNFAQTYICDGSEQYKLTNEWTMSDSKTVIKTGLYEPYGSKYPVVVQNAATNYTAGTTTATLLAPTSENYKGIDRYAEVALGKAFANFLANGKPKVLKDYNGGFYVITIQSGISRNYVKELGNGICSTSFSWVEISDFSQGNITTIGLLENQVPTITP